MIAFVRETQGLDFAGAIEWLAERFRIPLEYEEASPGGRRAPPAPRAAARAARRGGRVLRARTSGTRRPARSRATTSRAAGSARRSAASSGSASRSAATTLTRKALEKGFTLEELRAAGLTRQRGGDYFQRRLVFPLADARGRVLGFQARRLHEDDPLRGEVREHARVGALPQGRRSSTGSTWRAPRSRARTAPCVVEGNTDVIALRQAGLRAGRRVHGDGAHRAAAARARPADEAALARVRRRRRRRVGDAPRDGARGRAGLRRQGRRAAARDRPGRRPGRVRGAAGDARSRTSSTARRSRRDASRRPRGRARRR